MPGLDPAGRAPESANPNTGALPTSPMPVSATMAPNPPGEVLVAGGTGLLGSALVDSLRADHIPVAVLTRHPARFKPIPGVRVLGWNDPAMWRKAASEAAAVVNLTGASVAGKRWDDNVKAELAGSRIEPTEQIASAHPRVLIQGSAVGIYGDQGDTILDENGAPGDDFLARLGTRWEAAADEAAEAGGRVVLLRTGQVLARGGGMLPALLRPPQLPLSPWRLGLGGPFGSGQAWMPWIHVADWVALVRFAIDHPEMAGPVNAVAPEPVRNRTFATALGKVLGRPAFFPVPAWALRKMVGEFADALLSSERVVPAAALTAGFTFQFSNIESALADLLGNQRP